MQALIRREAEVVVGRLGANLCRAGAPGAVYISAATYATVNGSDDAEPIMLHSRDGS